MPTALARAIALLLLATGGAALGSPYGKSPGPTKAPAPPTPTRPPDATPRVPLGHAVPRSVLDRTGPNAEGLRQELEQRIEAATAAEVEAWRVLQSAYGAVGAAEDEVDRTSRELVDAWGLADYGADPYDEIVPDAEGAHAEAQERLAYETSLLGDALDDYVAASDDRRSLESLRDGAPALADLIGSPPSVGGPGSPPEAADGRAAGAAGAGADPTPEQQAHAAYRQALSDFADGNASFEDVETAHGNLTAARTAAGW